MQQQNSVKIQITVREPLIDKTQPIQFVTYQVLGVDANGEFNVRRRYRDFDLLRQKMVERWPGLYVPPISSKKITGNTDQKFVESRRKFLQYFCQKVADRLFMYYGNVFQSFIRGAPDYQQCVKELPAFSYVPMLEIYQKKFKHLTQEHSAAQLQLATETEQDFLKKAEKKLQKLREEFREVSQAKKEYVKQFNNCMENVFPQYEDKYLHQHVGQDRTQLIISGNDQFLEKFAEYKQYSGFNPLDIYYEMVQYQLKEVRALIESINSKQEAENKRIKLQTKRRQAKEELDKLKAGKTTFKSIFSTGSKDVQIAQLEEAIPKYEREEESLGQMVALMNAAIFEEIKSYKETRGKEYTELVKDAAKKEMKELSLYAQLLKTSLQASQS